MSQEILYTSARQGLRPDSQGYCTVVSSAGMAKPLADLLESLSAYRHQFLPHDPQADLNPINYSHYEIKAGGKKYHVLSRICDAGLDYSSRNNKLAHHVAFRPNEVVDVVGGPAWVMAEPGFFATRWDGETKLVPEDRKRPREDDCPPGVCDAWGELTGDPGWAGALAASALKKGQPLSIIYPVGTEILPLVVESLQLVRPEDRWKVTFSTYFTKLPPGTDCQWRFLVDGSDEATELRQKRHIKFLDLSKSLGRAEDSELVEMARTGQRPHYPQAQGRRPTAVVRATPRVRDKRKEREPKGTVPQRPPTRPDSVPPPAPPGGGGIDIRTTDYVRKPLSVQWIAGFVAYSLALVLISGFVGFWFGSSGAPTPISMVDNDTNGDAGSLGSVVSEKVEDVEAQDVVSEDPDPSESQDQEPPTDLDQGNPDSIEDQGDGSLEDSVVSTRASEEVETGRELTEAGDPFRDIRSKRNRLPLPARTVQEFLPLSKIDVDDDTELQLKLVGDQVTAGRDIKVETTRDGAAIQEWKITEILRGGLHTTAGVFQLRDRQLSFRWRQPSDEFHLEHCVLYLKAGKHEVRCTLNRIEKCPLVVVDGSRQRRELTARGIADSRLKLQLVLGKDVVEEDLQLALGPLFTLSIPRNQPLLEIDVSYEQGRLTFETFANIDSRTINETMPDEVKVQRESLKGDEVSDLKKDYERQLTRFRKDLTTNQEELTTRQRRLEACKEELRKAKAEFKRIDSQPTKLPKQWAEADAKVIYWHDEVDAAQELVDSGENVVKKFSERVSFYTKQAAWCDQITSLLTQLKQKARIQFAVYAFPLPEDAPELRMIILQTNSERPVATTTHREVP